MIGEFELGETVIELTGLEADAPLRLAMDLPLDGGLGDAITGAVEAAENAGMMHPAIDKVVVTARVKDKGAKR